MVIQTKLKQSASEAMAQKQELYLSVNPPTYKDAKTKILENQVNLLQILKKLQKLNILARQKHDLKTQLQKLLSSINNEIRIISKKLPTSKLPKIIKPIEEKIKTEKKNSRDNEIDEELKIIQEKLKQLNNM